MSHLPSPETANTSFPLALPHDLASCFPEKTSHPRSCPWLHPVSPHLRPFPVLSLHDRAPKLRTTPLPPGRQLLPPLSGIHPPPASPPPCPASFRSAYLQRGLPQRRRPGLCVFLQLLPQFSAPSHSQRVAFWAVLLFWPFLFTHLSLQPPKPVLVKVARTSTWPQSRADLQSLLRQLHRPHGSLPPWTHALLTTCGVRSLPLRCNVLTLGRLRINHRDDGGNQVCGVLFFMLNL